MIDIETEQRSVHDALSTAGMLCCRRVRGSKTAISNHSWGTAVDLKIEGKLDARGNDLVQRGLIMIAPIFNRHGWYWGAGFPTEAGMHFEVSREKLGRCWWRTGEPEHDGRAASLTRCLRPRSSPSAMRRTPQAELRSRVVANTPVTL